MITQPTPVVRPRSERIRVLMAELAAGRLELEGLRKRTRLASDEGSACASLATTLLAQRDGLQQSLWANQEATGQCQTQLTATTELAASARQKVLDCKAVVAQRDRELADLDARIAPLQVDFGLGLSESIPDGGRVFCDLPKSLHPTLDATPRRRQRPQRPSPASPPSCRAVRPPRRR